MMMLGRSSLISLASLVGLAIRGPLLAQPTGTPAEVPSVPPPAAPAAPVVKDGTAGQSPSSKVRFGKFGRASGKAGQPTGPMATLPGFRMLDGGESRVYVELSGHIDVVPRIQSTTLVFTLKGARVSCGNNRNPLLTSHFATPVARVQLVPHGADVDLIIDLRTPAAPTHRLVDIPATGGVRVEVDFPSVMPQKGVEPPATSSATPPTDSAPGASSPALPQRDEPIAAPAPAER